MPPSFWETLHREDTTLLCDDYPINIPVDEINALGAEHDVTVEWMKPPRSSSRFRSMCRPRVTRGIVRPLPGLSNCPSSETGACTMRAQRLRTHPEQQVRPRGGRCGRTGLDLDLGRRLWRSVDRLPHDPTPWCAHCDFDAFETYKWSRGTGEMSEWVKTDAKAGNR